MFSKELQELDRNTVSYMIDEMQEEINQQKAELEKKDVFHPIQDQSVPIRLVSFCCILPLFFV